MNTELLIIFIVLNIVNVILQTVKTLATVKCGKCVAALVNAVAFGLYTIVIVYTVCDLPLWLKAVIVAACNLVGVFVIKLIEEKSRKDKLWKIEVTIPGEHFIKANAEMQEIPHSYIILGDNVLFNFYCSTQEQSKEVKEMVKKYNAKHFVSESKIL